MIESLPIRASKSKLTAARTIRHWLKYAHELPRGRHLRSKIWWFAEFCKSHCLSQRAASFIVVGPETSIAESSIVTSTISGNQRPSQSPLPIISLVSQDITPPPVSVVLRHQSHFMETNWWVSVVLRHQSRFMETNWWVDRTCPVQTLLLTSLSIKREWSSRRFTYENLVTTFSV